MERNFVLSCCSTVDLPYAYMARRDIPVLFYHYVVNDQDYVDDMGRDPAALPRFYGFLKEGKLPQTSQVNVAAYLDFFEEQLKKGDLLHIAFTSGQSGSVHNAMTAGKLLQEKYPDKKIAILSCMDTRLTELLPAALGIKNGDVKIIKNAGGIISHPFGSVIRSLLVAIYELGVTEVMVIAHSDCGACHMSSEQMIAHMKARGIHQETIDMMRFCGVDFESWLYGFGDTEKSVRQTVDTIVNHPLIPHDIRVSGYIIDSVTGELTAVE